MTGHHPSLPGRPVVPRPGARVGALECDFSDLVQVRSVLAHLRRGEAAWLHVKIPCATFLRDRREDVEELGERKRAPREELARAVLVGHVREAQPHEELLQNVVEVEQEGDQ